MAVVPLYGVIGAASRLRSGQNISASSVDGLIKKAFASKPKAVVLAINSPGGSPVQSALIFKRVRLLAEAKNIPVYAFIEDVGASGGYWLALAADEVYAMEASIVGSIGVIAGGFGLHEFIKRYGIERRIYTTGQDKGMLDPFQPEKPEDVEKLKHVQQDVYDSFVALVKARRGTRLTGKDEVLFTGQFWAGQRAYELGLVDGIGAMHEVLQQKFGKDVKVQVMQAPKPMLQKLLGSSLGGLKATLPETVHDMLVEQEHWGRFGL